MSSLSERPDDAVVGRTMGATGAWSSPIAVV